MSDDLIRREDAIKAVEERSFAVRDSYTVKAILRNVPSAGRPQGEWIWDNDAVDWNLGAWICSNCHARNDNIPHSERIIPLRWSGSKFCPNCGARMFVKDINVSNKEGTDDEVR